MITFYKSTSYRIFSVLLLGFFAVFSVMPPAIAQPLLTLPAPGTLVLRSESFTPPILNGVKVHPENVFRFDFMLNPGDIAVDEQVLTEEGQTMIRYFLAALTTPAEEMWVNLSPYEENRIIPEQFGQTLMGRDLLAQDYMLKQIASSLLYPETPLGKDFWDRVYDEAYRQHGITDIPMDAFNKVWIVPESAQLYEEEHAVMITEAQLDVMVETDYLAVSRQQSGMSNIPENRKRANNNVTTAVMRDVIVPVLKEEVNSGKHFAMLRQVYHAMILATWYKKKMRNSVLNRMYADKRLTGGVDYGEKIDPDVIFNQYIDAVKEGVFNYIKEDVNPITQEIIPRQYFSGGADFGVVAQEGFFNITQDRDYAISSVQDIRLIQAQIAPDVSDDQRYALMRAKLRTILGDISFAIEGLKTTLAVIYDDQGRVIDLIERPRTKKLREQGLPFTVLAIDENNAFVALEEFRERLPAPTFDILSRYNNNLFTEEQLEAEADRQSEDRNSLDKNIVNVEGPIKSVGDVTRSPSFEENEPGLERFNFTNEAGFEIKKGRVIYRFNVDTNATGVQTVVVQGYDLEGNMLTGHRKGFDISEYLVFGTNQDEAFNYPDEVRFAPPNALLAPRDVRFKVWRADPNDRHAGFIIGVKEEDARFPTEVRDERGAFVNLADREDSLNSWAVAELAGYDQREEVAISPQNPVWLSMGLRTYRVAYNESRGQYTIHHHERLGGDPMFASPERSLEPNLPFGIGASELSGIDYWVDDAYLAPKHVELTVIPGDSDEAVLRVRHYSNEDQGDMKVTLTSARDETSTQVLEGKELKEVMDYRTTIYRANDNSMSVQRSGEFQLDDQMSLRIRVGSYDYELRFDEDWRQELDDALKLGLDPGFGIYITRFEQGSDEAIDEAGRGGFDSSESVVIGSDPSNQDVEGGAIYSPKVMREGNRFSLNDEELAKNHVRVQLLGDKEANFRFEIEDLSGRGVQVAQGDDWVLLQNQDIEDETQADVVVDDVVMPEPLYPEGGMGYQLYGLSQGGSTSVRGQFRLNAEGYLVIDTIYAGRFVLEPLEDNRFVLKEFNKATRQLKDYEILDLDQERGFSSYGDRLFSVKPMKTASGELVVQVTDYGFSPYGVFIDGELVEGTLDGAQVASTSTGGIDLNDVLLDMNVSGAGADFQLPFDAAMLSQMTLTGFNATILDVTGFDVNTFFPKK